MKGEGVNCRKYATEMKNEKDPSDERKTAN